MCVCVCVCVYVCIYNTTMIKSKYLRKSWTKLKSSNRVSYAPPSHHESEVPPATEHWALFRACLKRGFQII